MPVLANVLLAARDNRLSVTGTDLEVELVATCAVSVQQPGDITVPGRKLLDIFRSLPEKVSVMLSTEGERVSVRAGRSRFTLSSLPASEFPLVEEINAQQTLTMPQGDFRRLIDKTHFAMAQQDVRYYLNGLLLETDGKALRAVATDGDPFQREIPRNPTHRAPRSAHPAGPQPRAGGSRGSGRGVVQGRGSRDRLQRQLPPRCAERDRGRQGADRAHGLKQQLPHPRTRHDAHAVRRDAEAAVGIVSLTLAFVASRA